MERADILRRIEGIGLVVARRERREEALRVSLATHRAAHAELDAQRAVQQKALDRERDTLAGHHARIGRMMAGSDRFALAELNASMRYADVLAERVHVLDGELAALERTLAERADEIARVVREIAANRTRIEQASEQIEALRRELDRALGDALDEEIEQAALVRNAAHAGDGLGASGDA